MTDQAKPSELLALTTNIVAAHVTNNSVAVADLPRLIREVHDTLASVSGAGGRESERPTPAVAIKKSVTPDFIVCLEDGKKLKMLKRHLKTAQEAGQANRVGQAVAPQKVMILPDSGFSEGRRSAIGGRRLFGYTPAPGRSTILGT